MALSLGTVHKPSVTVVLDRLEQDADAIARGG
jgi:hypothetical protein